MNLKYKIIGNYFAIHFILFDVKVTFLKLDRSTQALKNRFDIFFLLNDTTFLCMILDEMMV